MAEYSPRETSNPATSPATGIQPAIRACNVSATNAVPTALPKSPKTNIGLRPTRSLLRPQNGAATTSGRLASVSTRPNWISESPVALAMGETIVKRSDWPIANRVTPMPIRTSRERNPCDCAGVGLTGASIRFVFPLACNRAAVRVTHMP